MRRRRLTSLPQAHINLTSLLDITFVLLIAFMVVAPALRYSVDLELPKVDQSPEGSKADKSLTISVTYNAGLGAVIYFLNGDPVPLEALAETIKSHENYESTQAVALEGDRTVPWEHMAVLVNTLKANNINSIGIITEQRGPS